MSHNNFNDDNSGVLNRTRTPVGKQLFKQWFLRPSLDLNILKRDFVACQKYPKNTEEHEREVEYCRFTYCCLKIRNLIRELNSSENIQIFNQIRETFVVTELKDLGSVINDVIDFDESANKIALWLNCTSMSEFASTLNVIYFPQLGYLIAVPLKLEWKEEEDFRIEGLYYQFSTATTVYYKNDRMQISNALKKEFIKTLPDPNIAGEKMANISSFAISNKQL
ncbi:520_t:CDS:2 [Ambispora leptoticha]|uniref:520_t:CDS:1 n=1 Tax=Ambispora leptoticha TaxID=144679 RepID=A0A9N8WPU2_9GLOM|nr:520_t:CDS:2 [Ambispora leptoticha]